MMAKLLMLFLLYNVFMFCEAAFVDTLVKCEKGDFGCQQQSLQNSLLYACDHGIPEIGIPKLDPAELKNLKVNILDVMDFTVIEGSVEDTKYCIIDKYETNFEHGRSILDITCPKITAKGKCTVSSTSSALQELFNGGIEKVNGKLELGQLKIKLELFFSLEKRDGDIYVLCAPEKTKLVFDIKKMSFNVENIYIAGKESSETINKMLNENWKSLITPFGKYIGDQAVAWVAVHVDTLFHNIPLKHFISDDMSAYVK